MDGKLYKGTLAVLTSQIYNALLRALNSMATGGQNRLTGKRVSADASNCPVMTTIPTA